MVQPVLEALQAPPDGGPGLRGELVRVANEARSSLGTSPRLQFDGPVESIDHQISAHLVPVLREALANVARHAGAFIG